MRRPVIGLLCGVMLLGMLACGAACPFGGRQPDQPQLSDRDFCAQGCVYWKRSCGKSLTEHL